MADFYSDAYTGLVATPIDFAQAALGHGGQLRRYRGRIALASQGTSDRIFVARIPAGSMFAFGVLTASATLGASATIAIGTETGSATGAGSSGDFFFTISSASGVIKAGQGVSGTGIGAGAVVTSVSGNVVRVSVANSGAVSGSITFGDAAKYRTAAVFTSADTPTLFGKTTAAAGLQTPLPAPEDVVITIGIAALPSSGVLVVDLYFSAP